jgi:hypothetical protein
MMEIRILTNLKHNGVFYKQDSVLKGEEVNPLLSYLDDLIRKKYVAVLKNIDFVEAIKKEIKEEVIEEKKSKKAK